MNDEKGQPAQPTNRDTMVTIATVVGALFVIGHITALFPPDPVAGWASAAVFTGLIFVYAAFAGSGRRSTLAIFLGAGGVGLLLYLLWFVMMVTIGGQNWYSSTFHDFQVGLTSRGWGHAGLAWLVVWPITILLMIVLAVTLRNLAARLSARI